MGTLFDLNLSFMQGADHLIILPLRLMAVRTSSRRTFKIQEFVVEGRAQPWLDLCTHGCLNLKSNEVNHEIHYFDGYKNIYIIVVAIQ